MTRQFPRMILALLLLVAFVFTSAAQDEPMVEPEGTISAVLTANDDFSTLTALAEAAELVELFNMEDAEYTLFAPTNRAFDDLPARVLVELVRDPGLLRQVLTYHTVAGALTSDALVEQELETMEMTAEALTGSLLLITTPDENTVLVNGVRVIDADIPATNGVIHAIDSVLLPPDLLAQFTDAGMMQMGETDSGEMMVEPEGTITDVLQANEDFSLLAGLVEAAGLETALAESDGTYTVFAPTNAAIEALPERALTILSEDTDLLRRVLLFHVVAGEYTSVDLADGQLFSLELDDRGDVRAAASPLEVTVQDGAILINEATVIDPDIPATNGIIHAIDSVLLPPDVVSALTNTP